MLLLWSRSSEVGRDVARILGFVLSFGRREDNEGFLRFFFFF